jgi:hypothetical protein
LERRVYEWEKVKMQNEVLEVSDFSETDADVDRCLPPSKIQLSGQLISYSQIRFQGPLIELQGSANVKQGCDVSLLLRRVQNSENNIYFFVLSDVHPEIYSCFLTISDF